MSIKSAILKLYYFGNLPKDRVDFYQNRIRTAEWEAIKEEIPMNSSFLDIGCGAGDNMLRARKDRNCQVFGVDPNPYAFGVGRWSAQQEVDLNIEKGFGESLPFEDGRFEVVFSSHVFQLVKNEGLFLKEANRVLNTNGKFIICVPTSFMAITRYFSVQLFTIHHRMINWVFGKVKFINTAKSTFRSIFLPDSDAFHRRSMIADISIYRRTRWHKLLSKFFQVERVFYPALYPYPDFRQLFPLIRSKHIGSSVFFVCRKK